MWILFMSDRFKQLSDILVKRKVLHDRTRESKLIKRIVILSVHENKVINKRKNYFDYIYTFYFKKPLFSHNYESIYAFTREKYKWILEKNNLLKKNE